MGLESINFLFYSKANLYDKLAENNYFHKISANQYVYKEDNLYWIDLELQKPNLLSIRITLCNPKDSLLKGLDDLLNFLFSLEDGELINLINKKKYDSYNKEIIIDISHLYNERVEIFKSIYGNYTAAIGSDEFFKRRNE